MKILIDDGLSRIVKLTGIGYQAYNLYLSLRKKVNCVITDYNYIKLLPRYVRRLLYIIYTNCRSFFNDYDIIHYQNYYIPFTKGKAKHIVTIHDLGVFKFPETVPAFYVKYNRYSITNALKNADGVITPSNSTKNEILELFPYVDPKKIFPCQDGIRDIFWQQVNNDMHLLSHGVKPYSYFFFLGSISRRKNLKFVLETFIKAKENELINKDTMLVLGGQQWWGTSDLKSLLREDLGIKPLGYLNDEEIIQFYKYSKAVIFPSLYEGFGMPIIEAMAQNIPVIISNIPTSMELHNLHNKQMYVFQLGRDDELINHLTLLDKEFETIKNNLNYGDLSRYQFDNISDEHLSIYKKILE